MRFVGVLSVTVFSTLLAVSGAYAADYDSGSSQKALSFTWTGPYLGVDAGYGIGSTDWDFSNSSTVSNNQDGGVVGFHAGYNQQLSSNLVVGFEGSVNGTDIYGHKSCFGGSYSCRTDVNMLADISGRIGLAFGRGLLYGKGGLAYQDATHSVQQPPYYTDYNDRGGSVGYLLGIGGEYALTYNISARIEYDFMQFSDDTSRYNGLGLTSKDNSIDNVIKAGMSLKLY
jgi:outer membrane immunogenic protein